MGQTAEQENAGGGSGYHLVTSSDTPTLASVDTAKIAGHQLKIAAYGNVDADETIQLVVNGQTIAKASHQTGSFVFDAIVVVDATDNKIIVQIDAPLTDTNTRSVATPLAPWPDKMVFELRGTTAVHGFQLWKLGLRF